MEMKDKRTWMHSFGMWGICFLLVLLFVGANAMPEYSVDTYSTYASRLEAATDMVVRNGRPVAGLLYWILVRPGVPEAVIYGSFFWAAVILFTSSIWLLRGFFEHELRKCAEETARILSLLIAFLVVFNPLVLDFFLFVECGVFALATFLSVAAFVIFQRYYDSGRIRYALLSVLLLLLSLMCYQSPAGLFVILNLYVILRRSRDVKSFLANNLLVAGAYGVPGFIMLLLMRVVFHSSRLGSRTQGLVSRLVKAVLYVGGAFGILPWMAFYICILAAFAIALLLIRRSSGQFALKVFGVLYICLGTLAVGMVPQFILAGSYRVTYPAGSIFGMLLFLILMTNGGDRMGLRRLKAKALMLALVLLVAQYGRFQQAFVARYQINAEDSFAVAAIEQKIEEYEAESGVRITKIAFYTDQTPQNGYSDSPAWDLNDVFEMISGKRLARADISAFSETWSRAAIFEVLEGRKLSVVKPSSEYAAYFSSQDWHAYSEKQLIFDEDKLHLCVY